MEQATVILPMPDPLSPSAYGTTAQTFTVQDITPTRSDQPPLRPLVTAPSSTTPAPPCPAITTPSSTIPAPPCPAITTPSTSTPAPLRPADRALPDGRTMSEYLRTLELESSVGMYEVDLSERLEEPIPVVTLDAMTVCSEGNLSAVVGEAKSKKTFFCSALVGGVLSAAGYMGFEPRAVQVLWIDTEQSESHVHRVIRRTHIIACLDCTVNDPRLRVLSLRELDPKLRAQVAFDAIELHRPQLVVIDGIGDLQYNTNDLEESEHILTQLMRLSTHYRTHILCVLHTNPNSDKARGHVGSALQRKAETVFYLHRVGRTTLVEPQFCRNEPFERFAFQIDPQGLPESCALPAQTDEDVCVKLLRSEYGGAAERAVLTDRIAHTEGCSLNLARVRITRALKRGLLRVSDDGREVTVA